MFKDVRLPPAIAKGAQGGPEFLTRIVTTGSGVEYRETKWSEFRGSWNVGYGVKTNDEWDLIYSFFIAMRGRLYGFRYRDYMDYTATDNHFADGDGVTSVFNLYKSYRIEGFDGAVTKFLRRITKPAPDETFTLYLDGVALVENTDYEMDYSTGIITFDSPVAASGFASRTLTTTGAISNNEKVTIAGRTYTFKTTLTGVANQVLIDPAGVENTLANLVYAIYADDDTSGVAYTSATQQNEFVEAESDATTFTVTAKESGSDGNAIGVSETMANASWGGSTLTGGTTDGRLTWTGVFDVPARFDVDKLDANLPEFNYHDWPDVPIIELHPDEVA